MDLVHIVFPLTQLKSPTSGLRKVPLACPAIDDPVNGIILTAITDCNIHFFKLSTPIPDFFVILESCVVVRRLLGVFDPENETGEEN
jgi:hypothetical protein